MPVMTRTIPALLLALLLGAPHAPARSAEPAGWDGRRIMEVVQSRHRQFPYVYEEQSIVLVDRNGLRDTRRALRYSRVEDDGAAKLLLVFDSPPEVRGVALLAERSPAGETSQSMYLPAFGPQLIRSSSAGSTGNFLGTDFSVEDLAGEDLSEYRYVRREDLTVEEAPFFVVDAYRAGDTTSHAARTHFVRQDNFFITRTDHYDNRGRLHKRQSFHDLNALDGDMWGAGMILMHDLKLDHQTLIKVDRRVFSRDYVPERLFTAEWLFREYPFPAPEEEDEGGEDLESSPGMEDTEQATAAVTRGVMP